MERPKTIFCDIDGTLIEHMKPSQATMPFSKMKPLPGAVDKLLEWENNKMKNPYTGKKIKENGPTYKKLKKIYDNYIKNELSPLNSIEDKDIISFKTIWTEINGEKKIVYKNISNLNS